MDLLTRRTFLHDLGLASASLAALASTGCRPDYPSSDFYVMLQGPWLLSASNSRYLRAMTYKQPGYRYDYIDPYPRIQPANKTSAPVFEARPGICLTDARSLHLDLCPAGSSDLSEQQRRRLFDGMRDQYQGLFYTNTVKVPDPSQSPEKNLDIHLSYPQEIFAMGLQESVSFDNLTCVHGQKINQWPTTIVLRYTDWKTATFFGDSLSEPLVRGQRQIHRKFTISHPLLTGPPGQRNAAGAWPRGEASCDKAGQSETRSQCCMEKRSGESCCAEDDANEKARQMEAQHAIEIWNAVMNLAVFPYNQVPVPKYRKCIQNKTSAEPKIGGDGTIVSEELKCVPSVQDGTLLALSAAGSAGIHGAT